ncbi:MAG TPA: hypothetical protein ENK57_10575 [Polyangiaceae bacterium]|nr:hypothetical protein [Polyangiaceae bacterium]
MPTQAHYTAHARSGQLPFVDEELARSAWRRLRRAFPDALAVVLMPDHVHLVAPERPHGDRLLGKVLGATGRSVGRPAGRATTWEPVPRPKPLPSRDKVMRSVRYAWLNPCRPWRCHGHLVQLVDDPLRWPWSTLRDSIGAVADPWISADALAVAFGWPRGRDLPRRLHGYAARDEHVADDAIRFPEPPSPTAVPACALEDVLQAALATTRSPRRALRAKRSAARRVAVGLAYRQGWSSPSRLAEVCGVHPSTVCRLARRSPPHELTAAATCLDPRLRTNPRAIVRNVGVVAA